MPIKAAGAVVLRPGADGDDVLVIHRGRYDDWTLPKGKLEGDELACEAAVREVEEETGCRVTLAAPLDRTHYQVSGRPKVIDWWLARLVSARPRPADREVSAVQWIPTSVALDQLSYEQDRVVLRQAMSIPATTAVAVLRHAKAVKRSDWAEGESTRPVTSYGCRQSRRIVPILSSYGIAAIHSSPWARCAQTVVPYVESSGVHAELWPELTEHAAKAAPDVHLDRWQEITADAVRNQVPTVICGHRPTLPVALEVLGIQEHRFRTAELVVVHLAPDGTPVAHEWWYAPVH